jgi:hypothetical protein
MKSKKEFWTLVLTFLLGCSLITLALVGKDQGPLKGGITLFLGCTLAGLPMVFLIPIKSK